MTQNTHRIRILALDVRMQRCGFAVLENQHQLLDWGITHYQARTRDGRAELATKRVASLLTLFQPSFVVLKYTSEREGNEGYKPIVNAITREARRYRAEMVLIERKELQIVFRQFGNTKYKIAGLIAGLFPELGARLPQPRKWYDREPRNMTIFDAVSVGLAYFNRSGEIFSVDQKNHQRQSPG